MPSILLLLGLLLAGGTPLSAQRVPQTDPYLTFAPFFGRHLGVGQAGTVELEADDSPLIGDYESRGGGGSVVGVQVGIPVDRLLVLPSAAGVRVVAALAYGSSGDGFTRLTLRPDSASPAEIQANTPQSSASLLIAKVGLAMRSATAIPVEVTVAPSLVRVAPREPSEEGLDRSGSATYGALNLGGEVLIPTRLPGLVLQLGLEDYVTFTGAELAGRIDRFLLSETGADTHARLSTRTSHILMFRLGLSLPIQELPDRRGATAGGRGAAGERRRD